MDETARVTGPGTVRLERLLPGPIERLWSYLVEPEKRARWFAGGPMELVPGGKLTLLFKHSNLTDEPAPEPYEKFAEGVESRGTVTRCEPPHVLAFTWSDGDDASEVLFELTPHGADVLLVLTHSKLPSRAEMMDVSGGWHLHLMMLEDLLRGAPRRPFWATHAELKQLYERNLAS